jgi:hypothetical protein
MADKVTITFDSFNDFQRFIMNPPDQRLKQIARGEDLRRSRGRRSLDDSTQPIFDDFLTRWQARWGEVQYAEGTTTATPPRAKPVEKRVAKPVPALQRVTPQEHVLHTLQRWVEEKKKPMPVKKLAHQACRALGYRATERALHGVLWHVHQLVAKKQIRRVQRGMYTTVPSETKAKKG